jgi:hypothetical protein
MKTLLITDRARLLLGKRGAFEGVARWPWMASRMGTDDARTPTINRPRHHAQRVVEKVRRSITNSETPQTLARRGPPAHESDGPKLNPREPEPRANLQR